MLVFEEKPQGDGSWINGVISGRSRIVCPRIAAEGQLNAYHRSGFWQPMDTLRDRQQLEEIWAQGKAPWKVWS